MAFLSVASEYFINSQELENKVRDLLPSQGGAGAGFDLSASTQIIPIIDLTESAEGSNLRQDLQTAFSHDNISPYDVENSSTTIINNTGFWRVFGNVRQDAGAGVLLSGGFDLNDGSTNKRLIEFNTSFANSIYYPPNNVIYDFIVKLSAGDSLICVSGAAGFILQGSTRQIASIDGQLV